MKFWFDTEFIEDGRTIDLISIGIVAEDGREFYAEVPDVDWSKASAWVLDNVRPHLWHLVEDKSEGNRWSRDGGSGGLLKRPGIAGAVRRFVGADPEFWAYYADYDWVVLCQLYGTMMDLPESWPMFCRDVKQFACDLGNPRLPEQTLTEHNALNDARWCRDAWTFLTEASDG